MPDQRLGSRSKIFWNPGLGSIFGQWGLREAGQGEAHTHKKKKKQKGQKQVLGLSLQCCLLTWVGAQPYWVRGSSSSLRLREPVPETSELP